MRLRFQLVTYRYIAFADDGSVLYVGISSQPNCRIKDHQRKASWRDRIDRWEFTRYNNRFEAMAAEKAAIKSLQPEYNLQHNPRFVRDGYGYLEAA